jgi:hypothetical protein
MYHAHPVPVPLPGIYNNNSASPDSKAKAVFIVLMHKGFENESRPLACSAC